MAKNSRVNLLILASILPTISFGIVVSVSYFEITNLIADEKLVSHTQEVIAKSNALLLTMVDAETGQRGYIITGNSAYLEPYNLALSNIDSQVKDLQILTADNPVQQTNINNLKPLVDERLSQLETVLQIEKTQGFASVQTIINQNNGKATMDKIRSVVNDMINEEDALLAARSDTSAIATQNTLITIIGGTVLAVVITGVTVFVLHKRLRKEETLEGKNMELAIEAERLRERDNLKDELSAMVSHELKTPLVTISGYAEMLKEDNALGTLNPDQKHAVDAIDANCVRLERLIGDILDVQKVDLKKMKFRKNEFDVSEFMEELIQIHAKLMTDKKIHFSNLSKEKIAMKSDADRLAQVFANLIKNAIDFVPEKGKIEIGAEYENKDNVLFYVKDNGSGIPKENQENLFKKFYQVDTSLKRKHGGTGLGLVICKGIVEGLGGRIWFESGEGKGTVFYFSIPVN